MSLDVSGLSAHVKENAKNIISQALLGLVSNEYVTVQMGIKSSENLNTIVTEASLQAGACGWSATGTTVLGKRNIVVADIMSQEALCQKTLENHLYQLIAKAGAKNGAEDFVIEEVFVADKIKAIQAEVESQLWTGDTVGTDFIDGFVTVGTADIPAGNKIVRTASVLDDIDALLALLPAGALAAEGLYCYMSVANYMALMNEIRDKNWFHIQTGGTQAFEFVFPGTTMKVVGLTGFGSANDIMIGNEKNFIMGTDLVSDFEDADFWFSQDNREHRFHLNFRLGAQIAIPGEVVMAS
jgi:hypothetical protein